MEILFEIFGGIALSLGSFFFFYYTVGRNMYQKMRSPEVFLSDLLRLRREANFCVSAITESIYTRWNEFRWAPNSRILDSPTMLVRNLNGCVYIVSFTIHLGWDGVSYELKDSINPNEKDLLTFVYAHLLPLLDSEIHALNVRIRKERDEALIPKN